MAGRIVERSEELDSLALNLYKHIQFAPKLINSKVPTNNMSETRVFSYFMGMKNFVKTGVRNLKQAPNAFYDAIQECVDKHVAQLTPKAEEKCSSRGRYIRKPKAPVKVYKEEISTPTDNRKINISEETMKSIQNANKVSSVGIKVGSNIKLFDNEDILVGYIQCLNDLKPQLTDDIEWQIIDISYKVKS